jgi:hypothetical protein
MRFAPATPAFEQAKTVNALDRVTSVIDSEFIAQILANILRKTTDYWLWKGCKRLAGLFMFLLNKKENVWTIDAKNQLVATKLSKLTANVVGILRICRVIH